MPLEYAGYVPTGQQIDWSSLSGKVADAITKIGTDRAAKKAELDKAAEDLKSTISNTDLSGSQNLNGIILDGATAGRDKIAEWTKLLKSGQMKPDQYKKLVSSLQDNWSTLSNSIKTFDERYGDIMKRQQRGEDGKIAGSSWEFRRAEDAGILADLTNRTLQVSNDGSLLWTKVDPITGQVVAIDDVRAMNKPENIVDNRLDLNQEVEDLTANFEPWTIWKQTGKGGEMNIEDVRENNAYKIMKSNVVDTIANPNNPRAIVGILADNGGVSSVMFYKSDKEKDDKKKAEQERINRIYDRAASEAKDPKAKAQIEEIRKQELNNIDIRLIKEQMGTDGIIVPVLTDEQIERARKRVDEQIEISLARKVTGTPQAYYKPESGGGADTGSTKKQKPITKWEELVDGWERADTDKLTSLLMNKKYKVEAGPKGYRVIEGSGEPVTKRVNGKTVTVPGSEKVIHDWTTSLQSLDAYFYGPSSSSIAEAKRQRDIYRSNKPQGGGAVSNKEDLRQKYRY
jgi:hypothetical protein